MKTCNKCNTSKDESQFEKGRNACRKCRSAKDKTPSRVEYYRKYQEEKRKDPVVVAAQKEKRKTYKEAENARNREYYARNKKIKND